MKATLRNGRAGDAGHNDRTVLDRKDSHIDQTRSYLNIYINRCGHDEETFKQSEERYYKEHYSDWIKNSLKQGKKQRNLSHIKIKSTHQLLKSAAMRPEETILQIGNRKDNIDAEKFKECVMEYIKYMEKYDSNVHILNIAIHFDESTPHAHIRKVWDQIDKDGICKTSQIGALRSLGFEKLDSIAPNSRKNNAKKTFDKQCREQWEHILGEHGFVIENTERSTMVGLSKEEYIKGQQQEEIEHNNEQIIELQTTIENQRKALIDANKKLNDKSIELQNYIDQQKLASYNLQEIKKEIEKYEKARDGLLYEIKKLQNQYQHIAGTRSTRKMLQKLEIEPIIDKNHEEHDINIHQE